MEDKSGLVVFDRKEVILIFLFMVVLTITSFTLGIKLGKKFALEMGEYTEEDVQNIELKSKKEEYVDKIVEENSNEAITDETKNEKITADTFNRLKEEFQQLDSGETASATPTETKDEPDLDADDTVESSSVVDENATQATSPTNLVGKFTIQLGSYQTIEDAQKFAEGFTARGYNPIINEVSVNTKGVWYRVSLGIFATMTEAKEYIKKEKSLFQGHDYIITSIK
ncbi:MAG: SPOR domain-containing protein [Bacteriovoracaceae bacterium]|nr:SPOR domain-containing protein [Bacteriovoracaceae bacterium]